MRKLVLKFFTQRLPVSALFALITVGLFYGKDGVTTADMMFVSLMVILNYTLGWLRGTVDGVEAIVDTMKEKSSDKVD